jgi:L-gulonolactone oxidase
VLQPASEEEVAEILRRADGPIRVAGAGHSFTDIVLTDGVLLRLDRLASLNRVEGDVAHVGAGMTLHALGPQLAHHGLGLENQGDIDAQTVAGALATGTHGTGERFRNLSANVVGMRLVDGRGNVVELSDPDDLRAARVSVGALGVVTEVAIRCVPLFGLRRVDERRPLHEVLGSLDELVAANDHLEFFAFPHTDTVVLRRTQRLAPDVEPTPRWRHVVEEDLLENGALGLACGIGRRAPRRVPAINRTLMRLAQGGERADVAHRVYASRRRVRFNEMEYAMPREDGPLVAAEALSQVAARRLPVGFPFEVRFVAGDDALLSPAHGRDTCYLAVHQYRPMDPRPLFELVEPLCANVGGRPHWGKLHSQTAETLRERYPGWDAFQAVRDRLDPDRIFTTPGIERILGP